MNYFDSNYFKITQEFRDELEIIKRNMNRDNRIEQTGKRLARGANSFKYTLRIINCITCITEDDKKNRKTAEGSIRGSFVSFALELSGLVDRSNES